MRTPRVAEVVGRSSFMAVSITVANVATYGFTVLAAHRLGPDEYGAVASLLAALIVIAVLSLGLQATGARRVSSEPGHRAEIEHEILRVGWWSALAVGAALVVLSPLVERLLRLDHLGTAALLGVTAVPLTLMGAQSGVLQGERRWGALSLVYLALGLPRLAIAGAAILWRPTQDAAMLGLTVAAFAPAVAGWWALRGRQRGRHLVAESRHPAREILGETVHNSQALLAFFALSNTDVIVARHSLGTQTAGLYAAGLILTKAMLFLPQFVVVVAFPDLSTQGARRRALLTSLGVIVALGVVGVLGALVLQQLALLFVGGSAYEAVAGRLWLFAALGAVLSMLQVLVYAVLARSGRRPVILVWLAFAAVVVLGSLIGSIGALLAVVLVADTVLLVALLLTDVRTLPARETASPEPTAPLAG